MFSARLLHYNGPHPAALELYHIDCPSTHFLSPLILSTTGDVHDAPRVPVLPVLLSGRLREPVGVISVPASSGMCVLVCVRVCKCRCVCVCVLYHG